MMYPLVLELAVDGVPVTVTCRVLRFSKQAFYQWKRDPISQRDWDDAHLTNAAWDIHRDDPAFGYRFISDELGKAGLTAGENRVWRLCSQQRLWAAGSMGAYLVSVAGLIAAVSVMRAFELGGGTAAPEAMVLLIVVLTLPLSTAYYVVGSLGSSQVSGPEEFAVEALTMSAASYYLGFFLLAAINAAIFRWIVISTGRRRAEAQADS